MRSLLLLTSTTLLSTSTLTLTQATMDLNIDPLCPADAGGPNCRHHSICRKGTKPPNKSFPSIPSIFTPTFINGLSSSGSETPMYCDCNEDTSPSSQGYTGVECDTSYSICPDGLVCFNGAECTKDSHDYNVYHCNCPTTDTLGAIFAGVHCEAKGTSFCGMEGENGYGGYGVEGDDDWDVNEGLWFCTNGGQCLKHETDVAKKCKCPDGFFGLHCELEQDEECNLSCENNGVCKFGIKDFSDYTGSKLDIENFFAGGNQHGMHCVCPKGYTGITCEKTVETCGDGVCFHGAKCVSHYEDDDAEPSFSCDCDVTAMENPFAGIYCEHESTTFCPAPVGHDPKSYFCTNGGHCPMPNKAYEHCTCLPNYSGPRCEFRVEDHVECDLDCNSGKCFFGSGNEQDSVLNQHGVEVPSDYYFNSEQSNMHCKCPEGYDGDFCEHKIEVCGENEHVCMNDAKCLEDGDEFTCDCEAASDQLEAFAGTYCEMVATTFCVGPGSGKHSFCTNHGRCKGEVQKGEGHVGCDCDEGFHGEYCQYINDKYKSTNGIAGKFVAGFLITVALVIGMYVGGKYGFKRFKTRRQYKEKAPQEEEPEEEEDPNYWDPLGAKLRNSAKYGKGKRYENYEPYRDEDDDEKDDDDEQYEMKNVELI